MSRINNKDSMRLKKSLVFHIFTTTALATYVIFFLSFYPLIAESAAIFTFVPAVAIAWFYGIRRGIAAGLLLDIINLSLLSYHGVFSWETSALLRRMPGLLAVIMISAITGYFRNLREKVRSELEEKKRTEIELRASEERFRAIFEGSFDALMLLDEKGFFDCNRRTCVLFGFSSKEEFTGLHPADISPPLQPDGTESYKAATDRIKSALERGSESFEWMHRRKNGRIFPAEVLLSAFELNGRRVLQATVRDISERKRIETELTTRENTLKSIFRAVPVGIALSVNRRILSVNRYFCELSGYSEEELIGKDSRFFYTEVAEYERVGKNLYNDITLREQTVVETRVRRKDGSLIDVLLTASLIEGSDNKVITVTDITGLKRIQEQLRKKNLEILEFTGMIAHDLRKPLTAIKLIFDMAHRGALGNCNDDGIEAIDTGAEAVKYMQEMLDDLSACARLEAGMQEMTFENISFRELVESVMARFRYQLEEKGITLESPKDDINVNADKKQLERVLMNLVGNSVNYIGSGPEKKIRIGWERRNGETVFFVSDNGIGIPAESQQRLFAKFKRGSNVSGIPGTGLGLSIVKGIIEAHGGRIWFESEEGRGTAFYFTLGNEGRAPAPHFRNLALQSTHLLKPQ